MRILCNILVVLFVTATAVGQQINPVPDYIFRNSMSVGRNAPTDTSAYFSIGPRFGATRGFMPPMVTDTASVTGTKRNGLLIYSIQRNSFLYWDSTGSRWSRIAANLDTLLLSTRAWRQKGIDSVVSLVGSGLTGTGISGYMPKWTGAKALDTSQIFQNDGRIGIGTQSPTQRLHVGGSLSGTIAAMVRNTSSNSAAASALFLGNNIDIEGAILRMSSTSTSYAGPNSLNILTQNAHPIGFVTNNLERARITGAGRFIINDTSSSNVLYVKGNTSESGIALFKNNNALLNFNIWNNSSLLANNSSTLNLASGTTFFGANDRSYSLKNNGIDATNASFDIQYWDGSIDNYRLRIHSNGRVGINTITDAGYQFDVAGSMRNTTSAFFNTASGESYFGTTTDNGDFRVQINGNQYVSGNVGIGTTSPASSLHINATATPYITLSETSTTERMSLQMIQGSVQFTANAFFSTSWQRNNTALPSWNLFMTPDASDRFVIRRATKGTGSVNWVNFIMVDSSGNMGIGTTSPSQKLHVIGSIKTTADIDIGSNNFIYSNGRDFASMGTSGTSRWYSSGAGTGIQFYPNGVLGMQIGDDNELKIAQPSSTADSGDYKIQVFGNGFINGAITTSAPSGGTKKPWKMGEAATVSPTSPNRTIRVEIDGVVYYIHAKTTND